MRTSSPHLAECHCQAQHSHRPAGVPEHLAWILRQGQRATQHQHLAAAGREACEHSQHGMALCLHGTSLAWTLCLCEHSACLGNRQGHQRPRACSRSPTRNSRFAEGLALQRARATAVLLGGMSCSEHMPCRACIRGCTLAGPGRLMQHALRRLWGALQHAAFLHLMHKPPLQQGQERERGFHSLRMPQRASKSSRIRTHQGAQPRRT